MNAEVLQADFQRADQAFSGRLGIAVINIESSEKLGYREREIFPTASMIKIAILAEVMRQRDEGTFSLTDKLVLKESDKVGGSGLFKRFLPGLEVPIHDVAVMMMPLSDNTATNMLIDLVGIERVNNFLAGEGLDDIRLNRKIDFNLIAQSNSNLAVGSPAHFAELMRRIVAREVLTEQSCEDILAIMRNPIGNTTTARYLPFSPYAEELGRPQEIAVAAKGGKLWGVRSDTAVVWHPGGAYVQTSMTDECADHSPGVDNESDLLIAALSEKIYRWQRGLE